MGWAFSIIFSIFAAVKAKLINILKYVLFLGIGLAIIWYLYDSNKDGKNFKELTFKKETFTSNVNELLWSDTSSTTEFYTIERSADSSYFEIIDTVKISALSNYSYRDLKGNQLIAEKLQYKIKAWSPIDIWKEIGNMNMKWYLVAFLLSLISNYSRAVRWQTIIEPSGYKPGTMNTFMSINIMYLFNSVIARLGEVSRCTILYRYEKIPVTKLVGTVLVERVVDFICFGLMMGILFISQLDFIKTYLLRPDVQQNLSDKVDLWPILTFFAMLGVACIVAIYIFRERLLELPIGKKVGKFLQDMWEGIKSTKKIERKWTFIFHTVLIWTMYFGVLYVSFFSYEHTRGLGFTVAFAALMMGSLGMIIPSAGGIGTWNLMVTFTLVLYGVSEPNAFIYSIIALFMMTLTNIVAGGLSFIYLPIYNRKSKLVKKESK